MFYGTGISLNSGHCRTYPQISQPPEGPSYPSLRTLKRTFAVWKFQKNNIIHSSLCRSATLPATLWTYYYQWGLSDEDMLRFLEREGYSMTLRRYDLRLIVLPKIANGRT
jgi:hypothetical protein